MGLLEQLIYGGCKYSTYSSEECGQLIILMGYLLLQNHEWQNSAMRLFVICHKEDNVSEIEAEIKTYLSGIGYSDILVLRINVDQLIIVPVDLVPISNYSSNEKRDNMRQRLLMQQLEKDIHSVFDYV